MARTPPTLRGNAGGARPPGARMFFFAALFTTALSAAEPPLTLPPVIVEERPFHATPTLAPAITRDDLGGRALSTLGDAVGRAPGLVLQESFGGFEPPRLSIRGSGLQSAPSSRGLALMLDGLPLGLADGSFNSTFFDPHVAEKIEIHRGLDGWRATPTAMGGELNLVSHREPTTAWHAEAGSFGAFRSDARGSIKFPGTTVLSGCTSFEQQDGWRDHSAQKRATLFARLHEPSVDGAGNTLSLLHTRAVYDVPGPLTLTTAENAPRTVSNDVLRDQPRREAKLWRAAFSKSGRINGMHYDGGLAWQHSSDWFRQLRTTGIGDSRSDDLSAYARFENKTNFAGHPNQFKLTSTASKGWRSLRRFLNDSSQTGALFGHDRLYATTAALALEDTLTLLPGLNVLLGGAHTYARREIVDRLPVKNSPTRTNAARTDSAHLAAIKLQWTPSETWTIFGGGYQTAEAPTFDDLLMVSGSHPNLSRRSQELQTQRATTWEIGTRGRTGPLEWDVAAFQSEWKNEILRLADASGQPRGAVNASRTLHSGLESSLRWRIYDDGDRLTLSARSVWNRFVFENDPVYGCSRLAGMPPCVGSAELLYEHSRGLFAATGLEWTARRTHVDHANRMNYGGHSLVNLRAGWRRSPSWGFFADVRNIFARRQIASTAGVLDIARNPAATTIFLPGNGRTFSVGVEWKK